MNMFIADSHFGHENILSECRPQLSDIQAMDRVPVENINAYMTCRDTLYVPGDISFRSKPPVSEREYTREEQAWLDKTVRKLMK